MIESLRSELETAFEKGKDRAVAFEIDKVELELKIAISRKGKGEAGVAFWVVKVVAIWRLDARIPTHSNSRSRR